MANDELARQQQQDRILGWSLRCEPVEPGLDIGQDLVFTGRFERVKGMDNLAQALTLALTTALGADPFNTSYGFDGVNAIAEERDPLIARERIRISVIKVLQKDPRIRRILDVKLLDGRLTASGEPDVEAAAEPAQRRNTLTVQVGFEVASGDQVTIKLGGLPVNV